MAFICRRSFTNIYYSSIHTILLWHVADWTVYHDSAKSPNTVHSVADNIKVTNGDSEKLHSNKNSGIIFSIIEMEFDVFVQIYPWRP